MQAKEEMGIVCPHCGRVQKVTRWHLVNLESEPLAKLRAFKGTLFKVPCEACGKTMQFQYPCVFLDETHRALLYLCPEEVEQDTQTLSALPPQEGYKLRLIRTPEELAEELRNIALEEEEDPEEFVETLEDEDVENIADQLTMDKTMAFILDSVVYDN